MNCGGLLLLQFNNRRLFPANGELVFEIQNLLKTQDCDPNL